MRKPPLPNFFVVGTGKAGTTSLYHYLQQHPQIYMSPVKEPCYFASEIRAGNLDPTQLTIVTYDGYHGSCRKFSTTANLSGL